MASYIYKKGITLPEAQIVLNASGGEERSLMIQIRGLVLGTTKLKNKALAIDFIDDFEKYFKQHSLSRMRIYEEQIGLKNIDVLDIQDEEFFSDLEHYLKDWFYD